MLVNARTLKNRVRSNVVQMLCDRKYESIVEQDQDTITARHMDSEVLLRIIDDEKLSIKTLRNIVSENQNIKIILVTGMGATSVTKKEITDSSRDIEIFSTNDFIVNVVRHLLVPKHTRVDISELKHVVRDTVELPRILRSDAVCRYYDYKKGDIIRIERRIGLQEPRPYYRVVCEA
jgi:DNA-directed RNA polymerase subunit H (RpoH/RPB5)